MRGHDLFRSFSSLVTDLGCEEYICARVHVPAAARPNIMFIASQPQIYDTNEHKTDLTFLYMILKV